MNFFKKLFPRNFTPDHLLSCFNQSDSLLDKPFSDFPALLLLFPSITLTMSISQKLKHRELNHKFFESVQKDLESVVSSLTLFLQI